MLYKRFQKAPENRTSPSYSLSFFLLSSFLPRTSILVLDQESHDQFLRKSIVPSAAPTPSIRQNRLELQPSPCQPYYPILSLYQSCSPLLLILPSLFQSSSRSRFPLTTPAFNQAQVAYNASKDEKLDKLKEVIGAREAKYKVGQ